MYEILRAKNREDLKVGKCEWGKACRVVPRGKSGGSSE